jgi:hypothetical protein
MRISFFIPPEFIRSQEAKQIEAYHTNNKLKNHLPLGTQVSWIYQTWSLLNKAGLACELLSEPPEEGVLFVHPHGNKRMSSEGKHIDFLNHPERISKDLYIIDVVADEKPHPRAPLHLIQNKAHSKLLPNSLFMPHWSEPNLIPRDLKRGSRFENIAFFGYIGNLASELFSEEWRDQLRRATGLHFSVVDPSSWNDYSEIDGVIAIRDFSRSAHFRKPATKLYNAWLAGVPFIGGRDSAFSSDGCHGKNYLAAHSLSQLLKHLKHLKRLKEDQKFRSYLVMNGTQKSLFFSRDAILRYWLRLIQEVLPNRLLAWQQQSHLERRFHSLFNRTMCTMEHHLFKK